VKLKIFNIFFALIFYIAQPISISKAELANEELQEQVKLCLGIATNKRFEADLSKSQVKTDLIVIEIDNNNCDFSRNSNEDGKAISYKKLLSKNPNMEICYRPNYKTVFAVKTIQKPQYLRITNKNCNQVFEDAKILKHLSDNLFVTYSQTEIVKREKERVAKEKKLAEEKVANENIIITMESFKRNPNNLPLCKSNFEFEGSKENCWGTWYYANNGLQKGCVGNCSVVQITESELINNETQGLSINYYEDKIFIGTYKNSKNVGQGLWIEGWGFEKRSECKIYNTKANTKNNNFSLSNKKDCSTVNNLDEFNIKLASFKCPGPGEYPYDCEINEINTNLSASNEKTISRCSDLEHKTEISEKGYKDIFFGMTEDEFKLLGKCKGDLIPHNVSKDLGLGDGLMYFNIYKYPVNAIFNGNERIVEGYNLKTISEIILSTSTNIYEGKKKFSFGMSGFAEIDEIRKILEKKYNLLNEPTKKDISLYNEFDKFKFRPNLDYIFENKETKNLIIYRIYHSPKKLDYYYVSQIHYLSKKGSIDYLEEKKSKKISEEEF